MTIITDKLTFGGKSLGKIDGKNVFVPYTIPGEELEINITESKRDYDNAEISKIIKASPHRVQPACPYYQKCGGCNMMHIDEDFQRELRLQILKDIFAQKGIDLEGKTDVIFGPSTGYRARFQLNDGGLSERSSNVIVPIEKCLCAEDQINEYLAMTPFESRDKGRVHLFGSSFMTDKEKIVISDEENFRKNKESKVTGNKKKKIKIKERHYFAGTTASPENTIEVCIDGKIIKFDARGFFQSNLFVFEKEAQLLREIASGGDNLLDMYAGCGSLSVFLAEKYQNLTLVEHNRDAIVFAEENLSGTRHVSYGMSGADWVKNCSKACPTFDTCIIDPPRSGMEKEVCEYLCKSDIPQVLSMSCDPATQARDCSRLIKAGYKIKKMYLLDFYPNTSHIESLALLER